MSSAWTYWTTAANSLILPREMRAELWILSLIFRVHEGRSKISSLRAELRDTRSLASLTSPSLPGKRRRNGSLGERRNSTPDEETVLPTWTSSWAASSKAWVFLFTTPPLTVMTPLLPLHTTWMVASSAETVTSSVTTRTTMAGGLPTRSTSTSQFATGDCLLLLTEAREGTESPHHPGKFLDACLRPRVQPSSWMR